MTPRWMFPCISLAIAIPMPALAAEEGPRPGAGDEKLPAQLPTITIQGQDRSGALDKGTKLSPDERADSNRIRLPEPEQRRATRDDNRSLMVNVTPSTLEPPADLPLTRLPYIRLLAGWGPISQYRLNLYDAHQWGPVLGLTDVSGHSGWNWSGWQGQESLDWSGIGRLSVLGSGFGWSKDAIQGNQSFLTGNVECGDSDALLGGVDFSRGFLSARSASESSSVATMTATARGKWRPAASGDHQPQVDVKGQFRQWGVQAGPEGYLNFQDFWSLSDQVQLQGGLGGGYWGREPILDPQAEFHYRPMPSTHLHIGLRTASELPDFGSLYLNRPYAAPVSTLASERVEGWGTLGGSHRFSDSLWGNLDLGLKRSFRHIFLADPTGAGLWAPTNAEGQQWSPTCDAHVQILFGDGPQLELGYTGNASFPLGTMEHSAQARIDSSFIDRKLAVSLGVEGRYASLVAAQRVGGGTASGAFALAEGRYKVTPDWSLGLHAMDVPLVLDSLGTTYFAPTPWVTIDAQYQF